MQIIIELRVDNELKQDGDTYFDIKRRGYKTFFARTLDLETNNIKEYTDLEIFYKSYGNTNPIYASYNNTDIRFIQNINYMGVFSIYDDTEQHNSYYEAQQHMYRIKGMDENKLGLSIIDKNNNKIICNIARLILTSPLPLSRFISETENTLNIPTKHYVSNSFSWKINNRDVLTKIVNESNKYKNMMKDIVRVI